MIFALSLGESVVNHLARRCCGGTLLAFILDDKVGDEVCTTLPCRDRRMR